MIYSFRTRAFLPLAHRIVSLVYDLSRRDL